MIGKCVACSSLNTLEQFNGDYKKYDKFLYNEIYLGELTEGSLRFNNKKVSFKKHPIECDKEQTYFHLTTKSTNKGIPLSEREPDLRRCERLHWIRPSLETDHVDLCGLSCFVKYVEPYKNTERTHLFNEQERYLIILEERENYYLLITAFYIHENQYLQSTKKRSQRGAN